MTAPSVAIASSWWDSPGTGMRAYASDILSAARLAGVPASPLFANTHRDSRLGFFLRSAVARRGSTPVLSRPDHAVIHLVDGEYLPGTDVGTVHEFYSFSRNNPHRMAATWVNHRDATAAIFRRARRVIVTTQGAAREAVVHFPHEASEKVRVVPVPFGVPEDRHRPACRFDGLWVNRWAYPKHPGIFLELARALPSQRFAVRSNGLPKDFSLPRNVVRLPLLSDVEMDELYRSVRAVVSTSEGEGWHRSITEAYLRRTPVVVPRTEPYVSIYPDRSVSWYDPREAGSLLAAFLDAVHDRYPGPDPRVLDLVSPVSVGRRLRAVYEEAAAEKEMGRGKP